MRINTINTDIPYDVAIDNSFSAFSDIISARLASSKSAFIVTDKNVGKLYAKPVTDVLARIFDTVNIIELECGENNKSLNQLSKIYEFLLENNADRKSVVVALGGGVVGDIAGLAAATYMRGIRLIQMPTTLLAQVDSSVGGKTAVDFMGYKNIIGAFYRPDLVCVNPETLRTLPPRELSAGMAEAIKYGLIADNEFYAYICEHLEKNSCNLLEYSFLEYVISKCVEMKARFVECDERETGVREMLNFGHTIGHAVESLRQFELLHGECVALGMIAALRLSKSRTNETDLPDSVSNSLLHIFDILRLPVKASGVAAADIYKAMFKDKKTKNSKITFILLKSLGTPYSTQDISENEIMTALETIL